MSRVYVCPHIHPHIMKILPKTIKHEKFKEMVRQWLDSHREEYCAFVEEVSKRDRTGLIRIFQYAQFVAPGYAKVVMNKLSDRDNEDLSPIEKFLTDADIASKMVEEFQSQRPESIVPAMLAWLYFGNSWEMMVAYNEETIQDKNSSFMDRLKARVVIYAAIKGSIKNEHRTKEDWEHFRKVQKSMGSMIPVTDSAIDDIEAEEPVMPEQDCTDSDNEKKEPLKRGRKKIRASLDTLIPNDTDRMKGKISEFIKLRSSGSDIAMLYIFLQEESHIGSCDISTFHNALSEHYPEHKFVGLRGVQKAHQQLVTPMLGGKRMIDLGQDRKNLENIRLHFAA